jgi:hypothetical protein
MYVLVLLLLPFGSNGIMEREGGGGRERLFYIQTRGLLFLFTVCLAALGASGVKKGKE